jgi:cell division protease FtsH
MLLGGYVAEQIVFERTTTGAADDLRRVTEISRAMIEEYGMGSQVFLAANGSGSEASTSQATLHRRDEEQQGLVDEAQFEARMLIMDNRALLDRIAEALLSQESLDRKEIEALIANEPLEEMPDVKSEPEPEPAEVPVHDVSPAAANGSDHDGSIAPPAPKPSVAPPSNGNGADPVHRAEVEEPTH